MREDSTAWRQRHTCSQGQLDQEQALLTQFYELFRTGYLAWGMNLSNPDPPFFHITEQGTNALDN